MTDKYRPYIGRTAALTLNGLTITVRVLDIRGAFGRIDAQVEPIVGSGARWFDFSRLVFIQEAAQ